MAVSQREFGSYRVAEPGLGEAGDSCPVPPLKSLCLLTLSQTPLAVWLRQQNLLQL